MRDDPNDKKIKEAADHYHPAYDDNAWKKMEQLLDEHLPQKKGRRWIIILLPLLLLLIGGSIYLAVSYKQTNSPEIAQKSDSKNIPGKKETVSPAPGDQKNNLSVASIKSTSVNSNALPDTARAVVIKQNSQKNAGGNLLSQRKPLLKNNTISGLSEENAELNTPKNISTPEASSSTKSENEQKGNIAISENNKDQPKKVNNDVSITAKVNRNEDTTAKTGNLKSSTQKKTTSGVKNSFSKNIGITLSAGPDISGVRLRDAGKLTISYGAGLRYSISSKFTVRAGFYVSKKIYYAENYDYHLPAGTPGGIYLQNVNANCDVYEIPISLSYSFGKTKNHNWFAAAGLSSYLMKKEAYRYNYKYPSGQTYSRDWSVQNQNQHFFSVLDLSGGYEYMLNKRFSIMAEPYISLPLSGIGLGKIKLNSGGMLFTLTFKPF